MRYEQNRGFKHCGNNEQYSVLACGFREVRDAIVVRIVDGRRVIVHWTDLVELFGIITCGETRLGQVAKLHGARAEVRLTRAFGSGRPRQNGADRNVGKVVSKWPCRNSKDGGWDLRQRRWDGEKRHEHATNLFKHLSHACVHTHEDVRATSECVYTLRRAHGSCYYLGAKLLPQKKIITPWPSWKIFNSLLVLLVLVSSVIKDDVDSEINRLFELLFRPTAPPWWMWVRVPRLQLTLGFPVHDLARTRWSSVTFGRSWAVLRTILISTFVDNFYDAFFQHGLVRNVGSDAVCQNSFLRRGQVNSALRILLRFFNEFYSSPSSVSWHLYQLLLRLHRCSFSSFTNSDSAVEYWSRARSTW